MPAPMEPDTAASDTDAVCRVSALIGRDGAGRTAGASHQAIAECVPPGPGGGQGARRDGTRMAGIAGVTNKIEMALPLRRG